MSGSNIKKWFLDTKHLPATIIAAIVAGIVLLYLSKMIAGPSSSSATMVQNNRTVIVNESQPTVTPSKRGSPSPKDTASTSDPTAIKDTARLNVVKPGPESAPGTPLFDVALTTLNDRRVYLPLYTPVSSWIKKAFKDDKATIGNLSIGKDEVGDLLDGNIPSANHRKMAQLARYLCLVRSTESYSGSSFSEMLVRLDCKYQVVVIENGRGSIVNTFEKIFTCSEIDKERARQKTDSMFLTYLKSNPLTL